MKFNKILLVSIFLLAILTLGAVSANDDASATEISSADPVEAPLATDISADSADDVEQIGEVNLASSDVNSPTDELGDGEKKNVSYSIDYNEYYINDYSSHELNPITLYWYEDGVEGELDVSWGKNGGWSMSTKNLNTDADDVVTFVSSISFDQIFNEVADQRPLKDGDSETVTISFTPAEGSEYAPFTESHTFIVRYLVDLSIDTYEYGEIPNLYVYVPNYGGDATIYVNGKKFKDIYLDYDERCTLKLQKLNFGSNTIAIELDNGARVSRVFNISSSIQYPVEMNYGDDESISLNLNGAKGNLFILIDDEQVFNEKVNGYTAYSLSDLTAGQHKIDAFYTGSDFEIEQVHSNIMVVPNVITPSRIQSGANFNITVESGIGGKLTIKFYRQVWEWDEGEYVYVEDRQEGEPLIIDVEGDSTIYEISYSDVPVIDNYYPDIYDNEYCFVAIFMKYEWQPTGGERIYGNRDLIVRVLGDSPDSNISANIEDYLFLESLTSVDVYLPESAEGTVSFYVDGNLIEEKEISDDPMSFSLEVSELGLGNHTFELRYSGDDYYNPSTYTKTVTVTAMGVQVPDVIPLKSNEANLRVSFLDDMGGFFTVYIDGVEYTKGFASKGFSDVSLHDLPIGLYEYQVVYSGDENNDNLTLEGTFYVDRYNFYVDYQESVPYGGEQIIDVSGPDDVGGNITVRVYSKTDSPVLVKKVSAPFVDGVATVNISDSAYEEYMFIVHFSGDADCEGFDIERNPDLPSPQSTYFYYEMYYNIEITCFVTPGDDAFVSVAVRDGVSGTLYVQWMNKTGDVLKEYNATVEDGIAKVTIPHPEYGVYHVDCLFEYGDGYTIEDDSDIYVLGNIVIPESYTWIIGEDNNASLELLPDANGKLKITEIIDGEEVLFKEVQLVNGKAVISLKDLGLGAHYLTFEYTDKDYEVEPIENEFFEVLFPSPEIPSSINYGEDAYALINLPEGATGDVYLIFDETEIKAVDGLVPLSGLAPGSYEIDLRYEGNLGEINQYAGHLRVLKVDPEMNITVAYGNTGVEVILPGDATGEVIVDVEGNEYYGIVENGKAIVKVPDLEPGQYNVEVLYSGDDFYNEKEDSTVLDVKKIIKKATKMTLTMIDGLNFTGVLKDENGDVVPNVEVVCMVGDERVVVKTNANGEFTVTAKSNIVLNMTFEGDPLYNGSSAVITIKNLRPIQKDTIILVEKAFKRDAVDYNAGERGYKFYFTLTDGDGNILAEKPVKIGVDGKIYNVKTDKDGKAGLMINLATSNFYTYAISFLGDDDYKASFAVSRLNVVKKATSITPAKTSYSFKASAKTKTITATLKSTNKYIPSGKQVTLTIAGKTFKATIGAKGQISLNIGAVTKKGTYTGVIKFAGTGTYAASNSKKITVKIS